MEQVKILSTVGDVINKLGGPKAVAGLFSCHVNALRHWRIKNKFPPHTFLKLSAELSARDLVASESLWSFARIASRNISSPPTCRWDGMTAVRAMPSARSKIIINAGSLELILDYRDAVALHISLREALLQISEASQIDLHGSILSTRGMIDTSLRLISATRLELRNRQANGYHNNDSRHL